MRWIPLIFCVTLFYSALHAGDDPGFPFPLPRDSGPFLGDPAQEPVQQERFRQSHPMTPFTISWPINEGDPFRDWGHFRLRETMIRGRASQALRVPVDESRPMVEKWVGQFENEPWKSGQHLWISVLSPPEGMTPPAGGWPVVFSFPGAGGVGRQNIRRDRFSADLMWATPYYREHLPAYVVVFHPQQRPVQYSGDGEMGVSTSAVWDAYLEVIDAYAARDGVNRNRLYAIGHSMGGTSTWYLMRDRPGLLAAAVPNAGQPLAEVADYEKTLDVPILMIQGHDDTWVGSSSYLWAFEQLHRLDHPRVRFWEIQNIGHSGGAMSLTVVHQWMMQQSRNADRLVRPAFDAARARSWTDLDGRSVEAVFRSVEGETVHLFLPGSLPAKVPLNRLSPSDQEWILARTGLRIWRNREGVELVAKRISHDDEAVEIETSEGTRYRITRVQLSEADNAYLRSGEDP